MADTKRKALITGITGQDGSYLTELLLDKGYEVHGIVRPASLPNLSRIHHLLDNTFPLYLHIGDLTDGSSIQRILNQVCPDEVYNLAAQSQVRTSFDVPEYTAQVNAVAVSALLEAIRGLQERLGIQIRFYQASTSELFGPSAPPQNEATAFHPKNPYGCAKLSAHMQTTFFRENYNLFACNGIAFNHESERRGEQFVTRKITKAAARIKHGLQDKLILGNIDSKRDWGHAVDYVNAMWMMLQANKADDYVIATGYSYSVREFLEKVFHRLELDPEKYLEIDERYFKLSDVPHLQGENKKISDTLGWEPHISFDEMINRMVSHDLELANQEKFIQSRKWQQAREALLI